MTGRTARTEQSDATRRRILEAAERLFAERGLVAVSNRQISEAAGQGNNTAVGYHFGSKADLVHAIARTHSHHTEQLRERALAATAGSTRVRDWVSCLVSPVTEHLASLGVPSWHARFGAQVMTDPNLRGIMVEESLTTPSLCAVLDGLNRCLPALPPDVHAERGQMAGQLMIHVCAERERALANGTPTPRGNWHDAASGLIDGITGLWVADVTPRE